MEQTAVEEKAKELFDKFADEFNFDDTYRSYREQSKQCALIVVDEIITALDEHQWQNRNVIEFYFHVKQEIKKL
jgi:hypothetical protein